MSPVSAVADHTVISKVLHISLLAHTSVSHPYRPGNGRAGHIYEFSVFKFILLNRSLMCLCLFTHPTAGHEKVRSHFPSRAEALTLSNFFPSHTREKHHGVYTHFLRTSLLSNVHQPFVFPSLLIVVYVLCPFIESLVFRYCC